MSSTHDIGDEPIEHDPTGVRALLSGLPDPGPMPDQLVARIASALATEAKAGDHRARVVPRAAAQTSGDGILRGQTRQERRRVVLPWLAAAAAVGVLAVSGTNLLHDRGSSIAAAFGGGSSAGSAAVSASSSAAASRSGQVADPSASAVTVMRTGATYTVAGLAVQASSLAPDPARMVAPLASESPTVGSMGTPLGARDCAVRHGVDPADPLLVDLATIDGTPGIVVVDQHATVRTAYAFSMSCGALAGPVHLP